MSSFFLDILEKSGAKFDCPEPYGPLHLSFLIFGFLFCLFIAWKLRNVDEKGNKIVLNVVAWVLILSEIYKQFFFYYVVGDGNFQWYVFPFQLCSVPMYLCLIAPWVKHKGIQKGMYSFLVYFNLLGGIAAMIEPSGILNSFIFCTFHSLVWHTLLIFIGLYLVFSGRCGFTMKDYLGAVVTFLVLAGIAFALNNVFAEESGHSMNMFFVGPEVSSIVIIHDIGEAYGWYVGTAVYVPVICIGAFAIFGLIHLARFVVSLIRHPKKVVAK